MRKALPWLLLFWVVFLGCASSHELRATTQILDSKIAALEKDVTASRDGVADLRDRLDKLEDTVKSIQRFQADTGADMTALRAEIQRLRGATEETRESLKTVTGEGASGNQASRLEELRLRMQYMEDFLGIGKPGGTAGGTGEAPEAATAAPPGKPDREKAYNDAYEAFKAGRYADARKRFEEFLAEHGKSEYGDNARFWIGECYYFEKDYERAILEYEKVITDYPRGNKVPNALLKQGLAFLELGDKNSGRLLLEKVIREHPSTSPARIAKIKLSSIN